MVRHAARLARHTALFEGLDESQVHAVLECFSPRERQYAKGALIAQFGEPCEGPGIVLDGHILIEKENANGERVIIAKLDKNDVFGEVFAFSPEQIWQVTVSAFTDCHVMFLKAEKIMSNCGHLCDAHTKLIQNMLKILSQKAMWLDKRVAYLSKKSIRAQVSEYLLEQHKQSAQTIMQIPLKRQEMADFLNVARPSLSRELVRMRHDGLIDFEGSSFKITDMEALKRYAG